MRSVLTIAGLMSISPVPAVGQSLQGAWKPVEVVITGGPNAGRHTTDVQPGLIIFTQRHYSTMFVQGFSPRPRLSDNPTDEELGRVFRPFTANAGMYELKDSTLTFTPIVAKHPGVMAGITLNFQIRLQGDSLWFITRSPDGGTEQRAKWVRTERP